MSNQETAAMSQGQAKTRRGLVLYESNPFLPDAAANTATKARKISNKSGDRMLVINESTGEYVGPAGFWQYQEVDSSKFIKLYVNGVKAFKELTNAGARVFELLYLEMQENIGKDRVYLSFTDVDGMSQATFTRGIRELIDKKFIAPTVTVGRFFVNPDYLWNGDRLAFVKEFRKAPKPKDVNDRDELEARGQQRLIQ